MQRIRVEQFTSQHQTFLGTLNAKEPVWKGNQDVVEEVWSGLYGDEHSLNVSLENVHVSCQC